MAHLRLTPAQRLEIARERANGVPVAAVAARMGVTRQTVHATVRALKCAPAVDDTALHVASTRVSRGDLRAFDALAGRAGLTRSAALKRLMRAADGVFVPGTEEAAELRRLGAAITRVGGNINQTARALNEARLRGQPVAYSAAQHDEVHAALALVFEAADAVQTLARARRTRLDAAVAEALQAEGAHGPAV